MKKKTRKENSEKTPNSRAAFARRTLCLIIALSVFLLTVLSAFAACSSNDPVVLECDGVQVTESMYNYWFITLKDYYVNSYSDISDSEESWNSELGDTGQTYAQFVDAKIRDQIAYYLAGNVLFKEYDLKVEDSVKESIQQDIDDAINSFGSRSQYNSYLERHYGIDSDELYSIRYFEQKYYSVYEYLYDDENGAEMATDAEKDAYFLENYARIKYLMVLKEYEYQYDDEGNRLLDNNGNYVLDELSEEEKAGREELAQLYYDNIKNGKVDIDEYLEQQYPDILEGFPNGYYVVQNIYYSTLFTTTMITAAFDIEPGEVTMTENDDAYFIIERLELEDKAYEGDDESQFANLSEYAIGEKFTAKFGEIIDRMSEDEGITDKYSVLTVD